MKTKLYGWLIAFFSLVLLHPSGLLAEGAVASANSTPKTAEELLVSIRDFLANSNTDGVAFIEKITGVNKANWGPVGMRQTGFAKNPHVKWESYHGTQFKQPLPVPYRVSQFKLEEHTLRLLDVDLAFFRQGEAANGDRDYLLKLTPELTQKILGPPDRLNVTSPRELGTYSVRYTYMRGRYKLWIPFMAKGDDDEQLQNERRGHSTEQIVAEIARRKLFENHKDFLALTMRLNREK
jgi:hypothetical protein